MMSRTLQLTKELIARSSVTPQDAGCLELIAARLVPLGFVCERMDSGPESFRVSNLWAIRHSSTPGARMLVFAGHTDVVPPGPLDHWTSDPFTPVIRDGKLYGRGAADMKASIAAMVVACEDFLASHPDARISIAFLLTSDEEGPAVDGTVKVCEALRARGQRLDWCTVGEPTAVERTGDTIKNGRRGTMNGRLVVKGVQGHIAYPQLAKNPIHLLAPALSELAAMAWDKGNEFFQPTSWQVSRMARALSIADRPPQAAKPTPVGSSAPVAALPCSMNRVQNRTVQGRHRPQDAGRLSPDPSGRHAS